MKQLISGEEGATMVEYALMIALVAAALITIVTNLSTAIGTKFGATTTAIRSAGS